MSLSTLFWFDTLVSTTIGLVALAALLLVLGAGLRRRLNQTFGLFVACAALVGTGSALANVTYWLDLRALAEDGGLGTSRFWMELAATGFYFVGPALLSFAIVYIEALADEPPQTRLYKWTAIAGFVVGLGLLPMIFNHQVISRIYLDSADMMRLELTGLGNVASAGPLLLQALTLTLFWRNRQRPGGLALAIAVAIWLIGGLTVFLVELPFPVESSTLGISIIITGYVVANHQIFNPLQTLTERLEATVAERTRELQQARDRLQRLNEQQQSVANISREIAQVADPTAMLARLVELIHNRFGYHHVYVYQPDQSNRYLVVQAAAGTTARTVMESAHRLSIGGRSLIGQAAAERQPRMAEARDDDAVYFGDTALPGARSEMALPLVVGDRLLGVLDLQSIHFDAFSEEDLVIMSSLADLVAVTLDNARLLQETEFALAEVESVQRQRLRQAWQSIIGGPESAPAYVYTEDGDVTATSLSVAWSPEIAQAMVERRVLICDDDQPEQAANEATDKAQNGKQQTVILPIHVHGQVIGALQLRHKAGRVWKSEDITALDEIVEKLGLALETARLSEETRQRAAREQLTREIADKMRRATDMETLMQITIQEMATALDVSNAFVQWVAPPESPGDGQEDASTSDG